MCAWVCVCVCMRRPCVRGRAWGWKYFRNNYSEYINQNIFFRNILLRHLFLVVHDVLEAFLRKLPLKHLLLDGSRRHEPTSRIGGGGEEEEEVKAAAFTSRTEVERGRGDKSCL